MARSRVLLIAAAGLGVAAAMLFALQPRERIDSSDRILVDKFSVHSEPQRFSVHSEPQRGDPVVFRGASGRHFIKRVVGKSGDGWLLGPEEK